MSKTFPYAYIRKKICKVEEAVIPIQSKAVQYGIGIFSGIRGHWNEEKQNLFLFRLEDHHRRMQEGAQITGMNFPLSYTEFRQILIDLILKNEVKEDLYIRPHLYAASTALTPRFDSNEDDFAVYMISLKDYFDTENGLNVCVSNHTRFDDSAISTKAKLNGAYVSSAFSKTEAVKDGYDEGILLNSNGTVAEAGSANIFGIKDGVVFTPPLSDNILDGITRRSLIELFRNELQVEVREESFDRDALFKFDELFFSGTAAKVAWIKTLDKKQIGDGKMGPLTKKVKELFDEISHGNNKKYEKWLTKVY